MSEALILDLDRALHISIVVQNGAIGVKWKDSDENSVFEERLFADTIQAEWFISDLFKQHLMEEKEAPLLSKVEEEVEV